MNEVFWALHAGFDREGPGDVADTRRALELTGLSGAIDVVDMGSGPGASALTLLSDLPEARVTALDAHGSFLEDARGRAEAAGVEDRLSTVEADMAKPPFPPASFDLIWSEGAAYIVGVSTALAAWKPLLRPGGRIAFSDAIWLTDPPHPRSKAMWEEYPAMTNAAGVREWIAAAGYECLGDFVVSDQAWENYYAPHGLRLDALEAEHGIDHPTLREAREEIAVRRDHGNDYGYGFFVATPAPGG